MLVIRLSRGGAKKRPFYHIKVAERLAPRDGAFIEKIGFSNPMAPNNEESARVDLARWDYWRNVGARPTPTVARIVREYRRRIQAQGDAAAH